MLYRRLVLVALIFTGAIPTSFAQGKPESQQIDGQIQWVYDYEEGKAASLAKNKPMFVVFRCER